MNLAPAVALDLIRREKERRDSERSLAAFTRNAFPIIEPGVPYKDNWHLHAIAEHLEAVSSGDIKNLIINIPPGCMKSILVSVSWPAWEWIKDASLRYMGASYGVELAIRDAMKCRDIVVSEWFQQFWPHVKIRSGEDQKLKYALTAGGWRMATSVGGRATGEHPDRKIVDDPHNAKQAESDTERENGLVWFDRTLSTRGESRGASTVVVMQRLHERDLTGHILEDITGYEHLCIPMEYEKRTAVSVLGWKDPREKEGDLLWPEMFPAESVRKLTRLLGEYGTSGQLQQRPAPTGGGLLKTKHLQMWPASQPIPALRYVLQSYDTAFTEKTTGDPTGCTVWGLFDWQGERCILLLDAWHEALGYPQLRRQVIEDWKAVYGEDLAKEIKGRRADAVLVEAKASGQSLLQDLRVANIPAQGYNPGRADKVARAHQAAPLLELDIVYVLESKRHPGEFVSWAKPLISQMTKFPRDEHDDMVDTFSQAMIYFRDLGMLDLPVAEKEEPEDKEYHRTKRVNPYAA